MTKEQLLAIVSELNLESSLQVDLELRIESQGVTDELRNEVQQLVEEKMTLNQKQQELIEQAIAEVQQTDAEVAKIVSEAEAELKVVEEQALKDMDTVLSEPPATATPAAAN